MTQPTKKPTFDEAVCEHMRLAAVNVLAGFPEVRSVAVSIDYHGALNDAEVMKGVWIGGDGAVADPAAILGSVFQTLRMLEQQCGRALGMVEHLRDHAGVLGTEIGKRYEEIQRLDQEIEARRTGGTAAVPAGQEAAPAQGQGSGQGGGQEAGA